MPNWVMDVSDCVTQSLSSEEVEVPELDIDPRALLASKSSKICYGVSNTGLYTNRQKIGSSTYIASADNVTDTFVQDKGRSKKHISDEQNRSSFVFDPVVGVIPRETRDLWFESSKSSNRSPISSMKSVESVRPDSSVDKTIASAITDKSIVKKMRVLPPVRYSNVDSSSRSVGPIVEYAT